MSITIARALRFAFAFALVLSFSTDALAQLSLGKISGVVVDQATREPLPAASVRIDGTVMGAMANDMGEYFILNVPPGEYTLVVNVIGYVPLRVVGVEVNTDLTTTTNVELESTILESAEAVEVVATRDLVEKSLTSTRTIVSAEEIQTLPVVNIAEVILTTAGSFGGNLRGGRAQDQQTTVDGSTVTGQHENKGQAFEVNPYMIQELEVKTGTFNAEYVNALSGITSVVTRDGGSQFSGNFEYRTLGQKGLNWVKPPDLDLVDAFRAGIKSESDIRKEIQDAIEKTNEFNNDPARADDGLRLKDPFDVLQMTGPVSSWQAIYKRDTYYWDYDRVIPESETINWSYLGEGRVESAKNSHAVDRTFHLDKYNQFARNNRTEKRPVQLDFGMGGPVGGKLNWFASGRFFESWGRKPNDYTRLMNAFAKLTYRPRSSMKLSFSGLVEDEGFFSKKGQRSTPYSWKYIAEGRSQDYDGRLHFNAAFTHTVSQRTFYELRISHLREYDERYHAKFGFEPLPSHLNDGFVVDLGYEPQEPGGRPQVGYLVYGDEPYNAPNTGASKSIRTFKTDMNFSVTSQLTSNHQLKAGVGVNLYDFEDRRRGEARGTSWPLFNDLNEISTNVLPMSGWQAHVYPFEYYGYIQDRIEYGSLVVNAGLRLDIFNANANAINPFRPRSGSTANLDDPEYRTLEPSIKTGLAPRLGISHPITDRAALHYSYGIFNQRPGFNNLYDGLVQSQPFERNHGNPDLPFQKATNYEMGLQAEIYPGYYLDVTGYFRDVNNLPNQWLVTPNNLYNAGSQREVALLLPTYAQDSRGLEVSFRRQMANRFSLRANYTLAFTSDLSLTDAALSRNGESILSFADFAEGTPVPSTYIRRIPDFDRRHRVVANLLIDLPFGISMSSLWKAQTGHLYRSSLEAAEDELGLKQKSRRSPFTWTADLYAQKMFDLGGFRIGVFTQINNVFDRSNVYTIPSGDRANRYVRRSDPVGAVGGALAGLGTQENNPRDIWIGLNTSW